MLLSWAPSRQDCRKDFPTRPLRCPPLLGVVHGYGVLLVSHRNATQNRLISRATQNLHTEAGSDSSSVEQCRFNNV